MRHMNAPLSQSSVSLKLEEIKRRCEELESAPQEMLELTLEDAELKPDGNDPYNRI